jgi:hypothetical protein
MNLLEWKEAWSNCYFIQTKIYLMFHIIPFREYEGQYDNLLYFFAFQYQLIQQEQHQRYTWIYQYIYTYIITSSAKITI